MKYRAGGKSAAANDPDTSTNDSEGQKERAWARIRREKERLEQLEQLADIENYPASGIDKLTQSAAIPYPATKLEDIPPEAEMDEGIVVGCWNGKRFVSWEQWRIETPFQREATTVTISMPEIVKGQPDKGQEQQQTLPGMETQ